MFQGRNYRCAVISMFFITLLVLCLIRVEATNEFTDNINNNYELLKSLAQKPSNPVFLSIIKYLKLIWVCSFAHFKDLHRDK